MNTRYFAVVAICVALMIVRCSDPVSSEEESYTLTADTYEPDNLFDNAKIIYPDSAAQERTLKRGDVDIAYFTAMPGKTYKIFTSGKTDTKIQIFNYYSTNVPVIEGDDSPNDHNAQVTLTSSTSATFYICVSGADEKVIGAYSLSIVTSVGPDSFEPDSLPQVSRLISKNQSQSRTLMSNDVDWVRFSAIANDTLVVTAMGNCSLSMSLFNTDTVTQLTTSSAADTIARLSYRIPASGVYFLKITGKNSSSEGSYTLSLSVGAVAEIIGDDPYEDDNTISKAKLLPGSSVTQQRSLTYKDTDWVAIPVNMGHQYSITFSNSYVLGSLHTKDGTILQESSNSLSLNSSANDTVYVKIYSISSTTINYTLSLTVMLQPGIPDQYEADNTREQVKGKCFSTDSLLQDRTITVVNSISDTDWIAFPALGGKKYTIRAITNTSTPLYMYLYSNNSSSYTRYVSSSNDDIVFTPPQSDTLYLMIYRPSGYTSIAYTLSVQGVYENDSYEPDSSRSTAKAISTAAQTRVILPSDTDWVKYTALAGDSFAILTTGTTDTKLALFSSSGLTPLVENDDIDEENTNAMVTMNSEFGGQFYIRVTGKTYGQYVLQVLSVSSGTLVKPDTFENDNSKDSATIIKGGSTVSQIRSLSANDTDWIAVPVVAGGTYTVTASNTSNYLNLHGFTSGDSLFGSRTNTTSASISYLTLIDDTIYFRISSVYTIPQYTLSVSIVLPPAPDSFEVDNTKEKAFKATGAFSQKRTITVGDTDWISIPVVAAGKYTLTTNTTAVQMVLFSSSGTQLLTSTSTSLEKVASNADTFYYRITAKSPQTVPTAEYTLTMSVVMPVSADSYENDNTPAAVVAVLIESSRVQQHTITPNDTDFVSFQLPTVGKLEISAAHPTTNYAELHLLDSDQKRLATGYPNNQGTSLSYTIGSKGNYYCRITSHPLENYSYTLSIKFTKLDTLEVGQLSSRNLVPSDTQWVVIPLDSGATYSVETNSSNFRIWIYDTLRASTYRAYGASGTVIYTPNRTGYYFIGICSISTTASGSFTLMVTDNAINALKEEEGEQIK